MISKLSNTTNKLYACMCQMLRKLSKQLNGEDWTWNNLNTLCWAIGSISGSMGEEQVEILISMLIIYSPALDYSLYFAN